MNMFASMTTVSQLFGAASNPAGHRSLTPSRDFFGPGLWPSKIRAFIGEVDLPEPISTVCVGLLRGPNIVHLHESEVGHLVFPRFGGWF